MRIVALVGEPASGKSTLTKALIEKLGTKSDFKEGLTAGHKFKQNKVLVIGIYKDDATFCGTDKLSMAALPEIEYFLRSKSFGELKDWVVYFEGDRITSAPFFERLKSFYKVQVFFLEASDEEKHKRHLVRNDSQSETFLKSRRTKLENFRKAVEVQVLKNNSESDFRAASEALISAVLCDA